MLFRTVLELKNYCEDLYTAYPIFPILNILDYYGTFVIIKEPILTFLLTEVPYSISLVFT